MLDLPGFDLPGFDLPPLDVNFSHLKDLEGFKDLSDLETWKAALRQYGYWAVFFGILVENTGIPVPGETITVTGGFLAGQGELNYWGVLGSAVAGAIVGDNLGYWIGLLGGWPLLQRLGKLFRISEADLERVRSEFQANAGKAVLVGRFLTLLRIFAGPLAGIAQMPYPRFVLFNALGAISWASVMVTLAFGVGQILPLEVLLSRLAVVASVALILFVAGMILPRWFRSRSASFSR